MQNDAKLRSNINAMTMMVDSAAMISGTRNDGSRSLRLSCRTFSTAPQVLLWRLYSSV